MEKILDCGAGTGQLSRVLRDVLPGSQLVALDAAVQPLKLARSRCHLSVVVADAAKPPFVRASFDAVFAAHLVEHLPDWEAAVTQWLQLLRPEGRLLLLSTPGFMRSGPRAAMKKVIADLGHPIERRVGAPDVETVAASCAARGCRVDVHQNDSWTWTRRPMISSSLRHLQNNVYSAFWAVPEDVYREALVEVHRQFKGRENEREVIVARARYYEVRRDE